MFLPKRKMNTVFWISAITITVFVLLGAIFPTAFAVGAEKIYDSTVGAFGWLYLMAVFLFVAVLIYFAFGRYGNVKLGGDDEKPAFPLFTWIAMLFSTGFGIALVFYGVGEPMSHFNVPPLQGIEPRSVEAARIAMGYSFFHYGVSQWSIFAIVGLCMAYYTFRKKQNGLISTSLEPLIKNKNRSTPIKNVINILAVVATIIGLATSIGLGVAQMNGGLNIVFDVPVSFTTQLIIVGGMTVLFLFSSITGLTKGMKLLSNLNMVICLLLMVFVFFAGPTVFILETFTVAFGDYLSNFINYSFRMTPYSGGTWVQDWTIFYWAWVIAWSPFVGAFIARISRGRTIREFVLGVMIAPAIIGMIWMATFGGTALYMDLFKGANIAGAVENDITAALFTLFAELPLTDILSITAMVLIVTFLVTSADSATYILASMTSNGSLNPPNYLKIVWGLLMSGIAIVLLGASGLSGLQTASLVAAFPFTIIVLLMILALFKSLRQDIPVTAPEVQSKRSKKTKSQSKASKTASGKKLSTVN